MEFIRKIVQTSFTFLMFSMATLTFATNTTRLQAVADAYLSAHSVDEHISAITLSASSDDGKELLSVHAGSSSDHEQSPIDQNNLFPVGSISKSYVAAIVLQLEDNPAYHFSIDDPIDKYFPEYSKWHEVNFRQLMNMTSGIVDYVNHPGFQFAVLSNPYKEWQPAQLVAYSYQSKLQFTPGSAWDYSNVNYILLGMLVEKLTGHSLADEIRDRLTVPLQLQHTYYPAHLADDAIKPYIVRQYAYMKSLSAFIPLGTDVADYSASMYGATGAVLSNSADIARWVQALFTPGKVLSAGQLKKLTSLVSLKTGQPIVAPGPEEPGYGLGVYSIYLPDVQGAAAYFYQGNTLGGRGIYLHVPQMNMIVSMTVNSSVDREDNHLDIACEDLFAELITGSAAKSHAKLALTYQLK